MNCNITNQFNPSSMTSFKEYFTTFVTLPNIQLSEGWGWFVDIESNNQCNNQCNYIPIPLNNKYKQQPIKYVSIPPTINEIPRLRSFKSMRNLHDESMIFKMDEDLEEKKIEYFIHSICILSIIGIFYGCNFL